MDSLSSRTLVLLCLALCALLLPCPIQAFGQMSDLTDEPHARGPFRVRSQFPFTLLFLGHTAEDASPVEPGTFELDATFSWSNTFVGSQGLRRHRSDGLQQQPLSAEEFDKFVTLARNQEGFYFDGEVLRTSLTLHYGLNERLLIGAEVPFLTLGPGYLDGLIHNLHENLGVGDAGRESFPRNSYQYALAIDGQRVFQGEAAEGFGIGDVTMLARLDLLRSHGASPALALAFAYKLPTGSVEAFRGSGHSDQGINVLLSSRLSRHGFLHANAGYVWVGDWALLPDLKTSNVYSAMVGYEHASSPRLSLVGQVQGSTSILRQASLEELAAPAYEATAGFKYGVRPDIEMTFSLTENFARFGSSPDIGFSIRIVYRPL